MATKNSVKAIRILSANTAGLPPVFWQEVTLATGLAHRLNKIFFRNRCASAVEISYDGAHLNDIIQADSNVELNLQQNAQPNNFMSIMPKATRIYVRGTAAAGFIYIGGFYQEEL